MYSIGPKGVIQFNFAEFDAKKNLKMTTNSIEVGLLFLRQVRVFFHYNEDSKGIKISIDYRSKRFQRIVYYSYLAVSAALSLIISLLLVKRLKGSRHNYLKNNNQFIF